MATRPSQLILCGLGGKISPLGSPSERSLAFASSIREPMSGLAPTGQAAGNLSQRAAGRVHGSIAAVALHGRYGVRCLFLVLAYYVAAHIGYAFGFSGPVAAVVWLPVGVGIAGLYLFGLRLWPAVVVADLLVNNYMALPLGSAIGQSFGNLLEVLIGGAAPAPVRLAAERR